MPAEMNISKALTFSDGLRDSASNKEEIFIMKRFIAVISALAVILTASAAFAVVQDFGEYTVDVIDGWTAVRQGETVYFVKNDNSASWSVMISELPGNATLEKKSSANTAEIVKTLDTKYFTFAIPKGWDGFEIDETSVKVENDDETASMYVEIEDLDGWEPDDLAEFYAKEHKAKDLKKEDGTYSFSYEEDGKLNVASFGTDGKVYVLVIQTAKNKAGFNEIAKLRGLMKRK